MAVTNPSRPGARTRHAEGRSVSRGQITDEMVERLARYLYDGEDALSGSGCHWDMVGDTPYTGWKNGYRTTARRYLGVAFAEGGESQ